MKIIITDYNNHSDVEIKEADGTLIYSYHFNNNKEAKAFMTGFTCCQSVANGLIQGIPIGYETKSLKSI